MPRRFHSFGHPRELNQRLFLSCHASSARNLPPTPNTPGPSTLPALTPTPNQPSGQNPTPPAQAAPPSPAARASRFFSRLGPAGPLALGALFLPPLGSLVLFTLMATTEIGPWLKSHEFAGVLLYVTAFATLAGLAVLPTYAQSALGGWAFGWAIGVPAALAGFAGGAIIGYAISRRASGDRVEQLIAERPKWKAVRDALAGPPAGSTAAPHSFRKTLGMVALLRVAPNSPFALTNLVMASVKVPWVPYTLGTMLGMAPRTALAVVIGAGVSQSLTKDSLEQATPAWVWATSIAVTLAIVIIVSLIARRAIDKVTQGAPDRTPGR